MAHRDEHEQARIDLKIALTGLGISVAGLLVVIGVASWLATVLH